MKTLRKELLKLEKEAKRALRQAEKTSSPEDWAVWKESECLSTGYRLALNELEKLLK